MRAVQFTGDGHLALVERDRQAPGPGELGLEVALCGICGSDLHMRPNPMIPAGTVPGHELSGRISEIGEGVEGFTLGERVVVQPFDPCGSCPACARGDQHLCMNGMGGGIGLIGRPGGYAEHVVAKPHQLFKLPEALSDKAGALVEPLAVGVHGARLGELQQGLPAAVFGAGPIGLMTLLALRALGHERLVLVEKNANRGRIASELTGVEVISPDDVNEQLQAKLGGEPPAVVYDCAGHSSVLPVAMEVVRPAGTVVMVGIADDPTPIIPMILAIKEIRLRGALAYTTADFEESIALLARGAVPVDALVTGIFSLQHADELFDELLRPETQHLKIMLDPTLS
jgi:(R,R)-butanediol dehydrogenase/meso-butanediol dehydrogenase/diacetyl reductase